LHAHAPVHANVHVHTHWQIHTHVDVWALTHKTIRTCTYTWKSDWNVESLLIHMCIYIQICAYIPHWALESSLLIPARSP